MSSALCVLHLARLTGVPKTRAPEKYEQAVALVDIAVNMCAEQCRAGRVFVFEHPLGASSWRLPSLMRLRKMSGVQQATIHQCAYGLTSTDAEGIGLVLKPTRCVTNSMDIADKTKSKMHEKTLGTFI